MKQLFKLLPRLKTSLLLLSFALFGLGLNGCTKEYLNPKNEDMQLEFSTLDRNEFLEIAKDFLNSDRVNVSTEVYEMNSEMQRPKEDGVMYMCRLGHLKDWEGSGTLDFKFNGIVVKSITPNNGNTDLGFILFEEFKNYETGDPESALFDGVMVCWRAQRY